MKKRTRKRLKPEQAEFLGLVVKDKTDPSRNPLYDLTAEQLHRLENKSESKPNDYKSDSPIVLSAWSPELKMMSIDEYCEFYGLPRADISSYKLVSHTGTPFYNIVFKENNLDEIDIEGIRGVLKSELSKTYSYRPSSYKNEREYVIKWADLHFGAHIRNLVRTPDYDSNILYQKLMYSVDKTNLLMFEKVHVHIMGDLIESFSGLNHINSWMSMDKDEIGARAVKLCCKMLDEALSKIFNLGTVKIVAGNHDRTSKANDEDVKGGAAELIAWGLELMGYDVEFHPYVITHEVDGIVHINLHGDKKISSKSTPEIILKYGKQGKYNFIFEAHLHTHIERLTVKQREKFDLIKDDGIDKRRMYCPSFFPGNYYSETLGFDTNTGFIGVCNSGNGRPDVYNMAV